MRELDVLDENKEIAAQPHAEPRFWQRQFSDISTSSQMIFDVAVGIVLPPLCFLLDPIVFNNTASGFAFAPELAQYKLLVYFISALSILTLSLWLISGNRSGSLNGMIAGILLFGSVCSLLIGIIIFPLSVVGLLMIIGVLGFTPFFTSFAYLRNSVRALNRAKAKLNRSKLAAFLLLGAMLVSSLPVLANWQIGRLVTRSMDDLLRGDVYLAESAIQRLRYVGWAADLDQLVLAYSRETDQVRKNNLARAYKEITGNDIETRLAILLD